MLVPVSMQYPLRPPSHLLLIMMLMGSYTHLHMSLHPVVTPGRAATLITVFDLNQFVFSLDGSFAFEEMKNLETKNGKLHQTEQAVNKTLTRSGNQFAVCYPLT